MVRHHHLSRQNQSLCFIPRFREPAFDQELYPIEPESFARSFFLDQESVAKTVDRFETPEFDRLVSMIVTRVFHCRGWG